MIGHCCCSSYVSNLEVEFSVEGLIILLNLTNALHIHVFMYKPIITRN